MSNWFIWIYYTGVSGKAGAGHFRFIGKFIKERIANLNRWQIYQNKWL